MPWAVLYIGQNWGGGDNSRALGLLIEHWLEESMRGGHKRIIY